MSKLGLIGLSFLGGATAPTIGIPVIIGRSNSQKEEQQRKYADEIQTKLKEERNKIFTSPTNDDLKEMMINYNKNKGLQIINPTSDIDKNKCKEIGQHISDPDNKDYVDTLYLCSVTSNKKQD